MFEFRDKVQSEVGFGWIVLEIIHFGLQKLLSFPMIYCCKCGFAALNESCNWGSFCGGKYSIIEINVHLSVVAVVVR